MSCSKPFYFISRGMNLRARSWGCSPFPACWGRVVTHSRFLCSHAPCSAVPDTCHTHEHRLPLPPPRLLAQIRLQHAVLKLNGSIHSPLWGCVPREQPILLRFEKGGRGSQGPECCCVLLQTEKADRRQNFVSLALRKRYSYLTEPGMSELLLPKY